MTHSSDDINWLQEPQGLPKILAYRLIAPATLLVLGFLSLSHQASPWPIILLLGIAVLANTMLIPRKKRLGQDAWAVQKNDQQQMLRWLINFCLGACFVVITKPQAAPQLALWAMLMLSAKADIHNPRHRLGIHVFGLGLCLYLWHSFYEADSAELVLVITGLAGMDLVAEMAMRHWTKAMQQLLTMQQENHCQETRLNHLKAEATIGATTRTIIHELNNMISIIDHSASQNDATAKERMRRSIAYIKRIHRLVIPHENISDMRLYNVQQLLDDLNLIVRQFVTQQGIQWQTAVDPNLHSMAFRERAGALYFIIHNLVKNACEAFDSSNVMTAKASVTLSLAAQDHTLLVKVQDNGPGLRQEQIQKIMAGTPVSSKGANRGLGLKFVLAECERNGFSFYLSGQEQAGSCFTIGVRLAHDPAIQLSSSAKAVA